MMYEEIQNNIDRLTRQIKACDKSIRRLNKYPVKASKKSEELFKKSRGLLYELQTSLSDDLKKYKKEVFGEFL